MCLPWVSIAADRERRRQCGAFAPDGKRMTYRRAISRKREDQLLVANADGSGEKIIYQKSIAAAQPNSDPSWSASGDLIAVGALELGKIRSHRFECLTPDGKLVKELLLQPCR